MKQSTGDMSKEKPTAKENENENANTTDEVGDSTVVKAALQLRPLLWWQWPPPPQALLPIQFFHQGRCKICKKKF